MPKFLTPIDMETNQINDVGEPTLDQDAATKRYVDTKSFKTSVRAATTVAGTLATSFEAGDAIDGVTLVAGDRILIKNQVAGEENGIYVVGASGAPVRAADSNSAVKVRGTVVLVEEGTDNQDRIFRLLTNAPITLNTTPLVFSELVSSNAAFKEPVLVATTGAGTLATSFEAGDTIDGVVLAAGDRILIKDQAAPAENGIYIVSATGAPVRAADADTAEEIASTVVFVTDGASGNQGNLFGLQTPPPIVLDTTGLTFSNISAGTSVIGKFAQTIGNTVLTDFVINHALASADVLVQIYRVASPFDQVYADVVHTDANNVTVSFASPPSTNEYRVVVLG